MMLVLHLHIKICDITLCAACTTLLTVSLLEREVVRLWTSSDFCRDQILLPKANVSGAEVE
jgi:hypothetical protein